MFLFFRIMPDRQSNRRKRWEVYRGQSRFWCDGRCLTAPNLGVFYLTVFLIVATSILFFAFDCRFLAVNLSPAVPFFGGLLFIFVMGTLLRASSTDPGIIPRATNDEAAWIESQIGVYPFTSGAVMNLTGNFVIVRSVANNYQ